MAIIISSVVPIFLNILLDTSYRISHIWFNAVEILFYFLEFLGRFSQAFGQVLDFLAAEQSSYDQGNDDQFCRADIFQEVKHYFYDSPAKAGLQVLISANFGINPAFEANGQWAINNNYPGIELFGIEINKPGNDRVFETLGDGFRH